MTGKNAGTTNSVNRVQALQVEGKRGPVMSIRRSAMVGAAAIAMSLSAGQPAMSESMADAMVMAVQASPELLAGRANVKVLAEQAVQARAGGRINVSGTVDFTSRFDDLQQWFFPLSVQLDVTQPLFTGGQVENSTQAATTRISAEQARLIASEQSVLLNTVIAYMDVRSTQTLVSLSRNNVRVIAEQLRAAEERFEVGEVTRTDVAQAEARLAAARSTLAALEGQLDVAREAYKRVVGKYPGQLQPPPPLPDLPETVQQALSITVADDPSLNAARLERKAAGSDVRVAIGALLPQLSLLGQVRRSDADIRGEGFGPFPGADTEATIGLRLTIPFFSGGANYSNIREAQAQVEARLADIDLALKEASQRVGIAWADLRVARATIRAGVLEVRAAQIAFEGVQEEAKVGARTTLDVLDAEQELLDARGDLVTARRDEYVAAYSLLFSIGKLTVSHLGLNLGDLVSVASYYDTVKDRNFGYDDSDDTVWTLSYRP
ncbi:MAG: TolC family outer membrane protein [Pseudomonadota bacterium]